MSDRWPRADRVAVVTGAARGIGASIAERLARDGFGVIACDRADALTATVHDVNARVGGELVRACRGDVTDPAMLDEVGALLDSVDAPLTALVNNAAVIPLRRVDEATLADFDGTMAVNVRSTWIWVTTLQHRLAATGAGAVVNLGSTHPWQTKVSSFPYNVSKGAVLALTKALAVDLGSRGIRVNSVLPGICATAPTREWIASQPDPIATERNVLDDHPLGRLPTTDEVASAVAFLCSAAASGITGTELVVDCGRQAQRR